MREKALLPTLQSRWPAVEADVTRGITDGLDDGDLTAKASDDLVASSHRLGDALDLPLAEARVTAPVEWEILHPWAARGVIDRMDDGQIGPGGAVSFNERIKQFDAAIERLERAR